VSGGRAAAAYGFSWLFARSNGDYLLLFELGGAAVSPALAIDLIMAPDGCPETSRYAR